MRQPLSTPNRYSMGPPCVDHTPNTAIASAKTNASHRGLMPKAVRKVLVRTKVMPTAPVSVVALCGVKNSFGKSMIRAPSGLRIAAKNYERAPEIRILVARTDLQL